MTTERMNGTAIGAASLTPPMITTTDAAATKAPVRDFALPPLEPTSVLFSDSPRSRRALR